MTKKASVIAVSALLLVFVAQAFLSMRLKTVTIDETTHLPSGYSYFRTGDFRMNPEQPPFIKLLAAAPLLVLDLNLPLTSPAWAAAAQYPFGYQFLFRSGNDADKILFLGRVPMVLLGVLLGCYVFVWSRELYGTAAGLLSLFFYVLCPNILAHASLVTMDLGLGCFMLLACYHAWKYLVRPSLAGLALTALFTGLAVVTKFSGLLVLPLLTVLFFSTRLQRGTPWPLPERGSHLPSRPVPFILVSLGGIGIACAALIIVMYGFDPDGLGRYAEGVRTIYKHINPGYKFYLNGRFSDRAWWYYYPAAFLMKTPIPLLILIAVSVLLLRKQGLRDELWLLLPVVAVVGVSLFDAANLGLRRILPVYPFLFVFIGKAASYGDAGRASPTRARKALLLVLCIWTVVNAIRIFPDHLTYFNELVGGPRKGIYHLDDSNIDWGQDLKRLKTYLDEHGIDRVKLVYFGTADPAYYGIRTLPVSETELAGRPETGMYYAISAHMLVRLKLDALERGSGISWLDRFTPVAVIGNSIYIYRF